MKDSVNENRLATSSIVGSMSSMSSISLEQIVICFVLMIAFLVMLPVTRLAYANDYNIKNGQTVKVGYFRMPGYHDFDQLGHHTGYGFDIVKRMVFYNNWNYKLIGYESNWLQNIQMLENGTIDLMTCVPKTAELEAKLDYSQQPVGMFSNLIYVVDGEDRFDPLDHSTYNGMRIGLLPDSANNERLKEYAAAKGFNYQPVYFFHDKDRYDALKNHMGIDALLESSLTVPVENLVVLEEFNQRPFYAVVKKGNARLLDQVDDALMQMNRADPEWQNHLMNRYYPVARDESFRLSANEQDYLKGLRESGRVMRVLINPDNYPYSEKSMTGWRGILIDAFQFMASELNMKYEFIDIDDRNQYLELLYRGDADIVLDMDSMNSNIQDQLYHMTAYYISAHMTRLERKNIGRGTQLILPEGFNLSEVQLDDEEKNNIIRVPSLDDAISAVRDGESDASTIVYSLQAKCAVLDDPSNQLLTEEIWTTTEFCLGINTAIDHRLAAILDKMVFQVRGNLIDKINDKYANENYPHLTLTNLFYMNPTVFIGAMLIILLGAAALGYMYIRQENMKTIEAQNQELKKSRQALEEALEEAERANAAKSDFLSHMSHDIRTPMNGILGMARIAEDSLDDRMRVVDALDKIIFAGKQLGSLLNDVLDMSKVESGHMELEHVVFNIDELLHSMQGTFSPVVSERNIEVESHFNQHHVCVYGSPRHLTRVIMNIVSNAIKYNKPNGKIICYLDEFSIDDKHATYRFIIKDNGIGMKPEYLEHIFEPFSREHSDAGTKYRGTGLGMAITKEFVELMGGRIYVESVLGEGSTFTVEIPFELASKPKTTEETTDSAIAEDCLKGRHILIAEDNELNQDIITFLLEGYGAEIKIAENGKLALDELAGSEPGHYDMVLMDIRMPVMDGYEATRAMRKLQRSDYKRIPIIAMTANAFADDVRQCLEAGMNYHLAKPIDPDNTVRVMLRFLNKSDKLSEV